jgi:hypothetical protein
MKYLLLIFSLCLFCTISRAQDKTIGTPSSSTFETKARLIITEIRDTVPIPLSNEQVNQLTLVTSEYWIDLQELQGQKNYEEKSAKLLVRRDIEIQKIIMDEKKYEAYQKQFNLILTRQKAGSNMRR